MSTDGKSAFVSRFDLIWAQARRVQISQALCWAVLTLLAGVATLAALDYWLELSLPLRMGAMGAIAAGSIAVAIVLAIQSVRRWRRQATAAAIEQVFPQLGQRIRTTVQFSELSEGEITHEGVASTLVAALEADTVQKADPLPLDAVIPWRSLAVASLLAAGVGMALAGLTAYDWQWRAAAKRALLADNPYTEITVKPGNLTLKEGESALVSVMVAGRTGENVTFFSRRKNAEDGQWDEETFPLEPSKDPTVSQATAEIPLDRMKHALEYRVAAGSTTSPTYEVTVLYPLKIVKIESLTTPPEYTGQDPGVSEGGNLTGLEGSKVELTIELDRPAAHASLLLTPISGRKLPDAPGAETLPLVSAENKLTAQLDLTGDFTYTIVAKAEDGMELPENRYRIRVRQDEPPKVWFESPAEALEVHTLAEILMRIRASDDYGLARTGIMFEVNNEEEYPLLSQDFAAAAAELKETGKLKPQTRATLEKMLPLEHFELTQQDSVMYFAFAEDNRPSGVQRTESDLRFIDIRPFRRNYRLIDLDGMMAGGNQGPQLKTLEELIARQRYSLNRTIQLARRFQHGQTDLSGVDGMIKFQGELAKFTRELAEGLNARGIDDTELLFQAEASMLGAADSLSAGSYDTATLQERDALKYLIEGRNRIQIQIMKNPNRAQLAQLRQFDRLQQQKLRRPKSDEQEAQEVAKRLDELAAQEDFVYATLSGEGNPRAQKQPGDPMTSATGSGNEPMETPEAKPGENGKPGEDPPMPSDVAGNEPTEPPAAGTSAPTREELEDKQLDIAAEAREIEKVLAGLNRITDLAKERMAAAAKVAEDASAAFGSGKMDDARGAAGAAREQFSELADQVRALLAEEQADRIAAAQQMAAQLARQQQDFADKLAKNDNPMGGIGEQPMKPQEDKPGVGQGKEENPDAKMPGLGAEAEKIAERAQTLADVLAGAAKADTPEEEGTGEKVNELVKGMGIGELTERLQDLPGQVGAGKKEEAKTNVGDGAERLESAAQQLAALHRSIVAPRVDELAKAEQRLTGLERELDQLDTTAKITGWHMAADDLLADLEEEAVSQELKEAFAEEMKKGGWGSELRTRGWNWNRLDGGYYAAPAGYRRHIALMLASIRGRMQELMLGDLASSGDEPIPPQYQELVDRYYQVLASEGKDKMKAGTGQRAKSSP